MADYKSSPLGAGFGSLQGGPPPATVLLNLVPFPATQRTLLFVSISGSPGDRREERDLSRSDLPSCDPLPSPLKSGAQGSRRREKPQSEVSRLLKAVSAPWQQSAGKGGTDAQGPAFPLP